MPSWLRSLAVVAILAALLAIPRVVAVYYTQLLILTLIFGLMAMSLDLLIGYTGLTSFGHAAYFGAAAYAMGVLSVRHHTPLLVAVSGSLLFVLVMALLFGLVALRATEVYFLIITLALGMATWGLAYRWVSLTGGDNGLPGIRPPDLGLPWSLDDPVNLYYLILAVVALTTFLLYRLVNSPFGLSLRGIRESESRMRMLGYNTWLHKYAIFVIAGVCSGLGGILYAFYNGFVSPADVHLTASAEGVLMVLVGGAGTLFGPLVGAGLVVFLRNLLSAYTQRWLLILGAVYVGVVMYAPRGIVGALWAAWNRRQLKIKPAPEAMADEIRSVTASTNPDHGERRTV
jgi:branched-chain amino acid transport system permease protein